MKINKKASLVFMLVLVLFIFLPAQESYLKLNKLKILINKTKNEKIDTKKQPKKKINELKESRKTHPLEGERISEEIKQNPKPKVLGIIISENNRLNSILLEYNENYIFLKEGQVDDIFNIKADKISKDKVSLIINEKEIVLEVPDDK